MPGTLEGKPRMKSRHCCACDNDHRTLENHEWNLLVEQFAVEPAAEFCDSKDASDEDGKDSETEACAY